MSNIKNFKNFDNYQNFFLIFIGKDFENITGTQEFPIEDNIFIEAYLFLNICYFQHSDNSEIIYGFLHNLIGNDSVNLPIRIRNMSSLLKHHFFECGRFL